MNYCKKDVFASRYEAHQCRRAAVKDGYCTQHHPDAAAKRRAKSEELYERKRAERQAPYDQITILAAEVRSLRELVDESTASLAARVKVENEMWEVVNGKRAFPDLAVVKNWALRLGVPPDVLKRFNVAKGEGV